MDGGATWTDVTASVTGTAITWTGVTLQPGASSLQLRVVDAAGNPGAVATQAYTLDTAAPVVATLAPVDDAAGVNVGANLVLTLDQAIAKGTGAIELRSSSGMIRPH